MMAPTEAGCISQTGRSSGDYSDADTSMAGSASNRLLVRNRRLHKEQAYYPGLVQGHLYHEQGPGLTRRIPGPLLVRFLFGEGETDHLVLMRATLFISWRGQGMGEERRLVERNSPTQSSPAPSLLWTPLDPAERTSRTLTSGDEFAMNPR
jgi:hypothetical protein